MGTTITIGILVAMAVACAVVALFAPTHRITDMPISVRTGWIITSAAFALIGGLMLTVSSATTVAANKVGVVTEFGRYVNTIPPGLHWVAPWADIEEFGTRVQPLVMYNIDIRFNGNSGGTANQVVEWRLDALDPNGEVREDRIRELWQTYRTFEAIENRVVRTTALTSLNVQLAEYTPSEGVSGRNLPAITVAVQEQLREVLADTGVVISRVTITGINPDPQSQDRINRQVQAQADLERTATTKEIAAQEAEIALIRERTQTPQSLQYECLRIASDWNQAAQGPLPPTFNCAFGAPSAQPPLIIGR